MQPFPSHALSSLDTDRIFVAIASYRDAQLVPTVQDCLAKAEHPGRVRVGICWQHGAEETSLPFAGDPRIFILNVDWRDSRGACWARAQTMKLWNGEEWFLQIDAHSRFSPAWDTRLIAAAIGTGSEKPILSAYPAAFKPARSPGDKEVLSGSPHKIAMHGFSSDGIPELRSLPLPVGNTHLRPVPARFIAAGFLFAPGSFVEQVPYDPELYFHGEEIAMALRAYTSGYDLFHPAETLLWHDYERHDAARHWQDHTPENEAAKPATAWGELDLMSKRRVRALLSGESTGRFSLGMVRSLEDYENYAGISFRHRKIQDYTRLGDDPPNPPISSGWPEQIFTWLVRILIEPNKLPAGTLERPRTWQIAIRDAQNREFYRRPFTAEELAGITGNEPSAAIICEIQSGLVPVTWSLDPMNRKNGWLPKIQGRLTEEDYSIILEEDEPSPIHPSTVID